MHMLCEGFAMYIPWYRRRRNKRHAKTTHYMINPPRLRKWQWVRQVFIPPRSDDARITHLVEEGDDDVVLLYTLPVEVLPHRFRQVLLALSSVDRFPCHRRGPEAHARLSQDPVLVWIGEGSRRVESVFTPVVVEDVSIEGRPLHLEKNGHSSANTKYKKNRHDCLEWSYPRAIGLLWYSRCHWYRRRCSCSVDRGHCCIFRLRAHRTVHTLKLSIGSMISRSGVAIFNACRLRLCLVVVHLWFGGHCVGGSNSWWLIRGNSFLGRIYVGRI